MAEIIKLFIAFARVGILGFGGGPSSIPLVEIEAVDNYGWLTGEEFSEVLAMGNALPGPIATKMAGYIGFKVAGIVGAVSAVLGTILPSLIAILLLFNLLSQFRQVPWVAGMTKAIRPVVGVLLGILVYEVFFKAVITTSLGLTVGIALASFLAIQTFHVHPAIVIVFTLIFGAFGVR